MLEKKTFPIEKIYVPTKRAKTLDQDKVLALANDILENGQKTPIRLRADGERFVLIEGFHRLEALRDDLTEVDRASASARETVELDQTRVGRLSRMDAMQAQAMAQASNQRREATLKKIDAALQRLDDDEFGLCLSCDEPINPKRLEFDPTATLCIDCASKSENR